MQTDPLAFTFPSPFSVLPVCYRLHYPARYPYSRFGISSVKRALSLLLVRRWFGYRDVPLALAYEGSSARSWFGIGSAKRTGCEKHVSNKFIQNLSIYTRVSSLLARPSISQCAEPAHHLQIPVARYRIGLRLAFTGLWFSGGGLLVGFVR